MNILITGGTGFIGSSIAFALIANGNKVFITGREHNIPKGAILCNTHLTGLNWTALSRENIEVVYHLAANNNTQSQDEDDMMRANYDAACYLFNAMYSFGCRKFIYASSTAVYGNGPVPYVENQALEPLTIYGKTKAMFDKFAMDFAKERPEISVIGFRYSNVYGQGELHKGKRASMVYQILKEGWDGWASPKLFEFGEQSRDWIYIKDVVKANLLALKYNNNGIFNCATGVSTSFNKIVDIINQTANANWKPEYIKNPISQTYQNNTCCNIDKIKQELGFQVNYPIERGIGEMVIYFSI